MPEPVSSAEASGVRVSVILTVYKRTEYLGEALESILAQSFTNYEVIIADDSGNAGAREVVARFQDQRLRYLPNPRTLGIACNVAQAMQHARGEYVAILNDDDLWEREFLAELVRPLDVTPERVAAFCDHWVIDAQGKIDASLSEMWSSNFGRAALHEGALANAAELAVIKHAVPGVLACVFRRDALDWALLVPEVTDAYDYWIACLLAATGRPLYFVPKRLAKWRVHGAMQTVQSCPDSGVNTVFILSVLYERRWFPQLERTLKAALADALYSVGRNHLRCGYASKARSYYWRCFSLSFRGRAILAASVAFLPLPVREALGAFRRGLRSAVGFGREPAEGKLISRLPSACSTEK